MGEPIYRDPKVRWLEVEAQACAICGAVTTSAVMGPDSLLPLCRSHPVLATGEDGVPLLWKRWKVVRPGALLPAEG